MSWKIQIEKEGGVVTLEGEIGIHSASEFYQSVLSLAGSSSSLGVNAASAGCLHTSIMQILFSLSKAVPEFGIIPDASPAFIASEARVGIHLPRRKPADVSNSTLPVAVKVIKKTKTSKKKLKGA